MLSELKQTNKKLREKLNKLKSESARLTAENTLHLNNPSLMETSLSSSCSSACR